MTKTTKTKDDNTLVKSVDGVRWYTFYNNKDAKVTLLSQEAPTTKQEIVLQHWGDHDGRKDIRYAKFDNYREAFRYIKYPINRAKRSSHVNGDRFFEYVRDGEMRPFFDIDMKMDRCSKSNTRRAGKVVAAFTSGLMECFEETGHAIDPFDIRLYESCGECTGGYKYSYHIVLTSVTLFNVAHVETLAKAAAAKASALLGDLQYLLYNDDGSFSYDLKIYSSLRAFRLLGSSKDGETRIKKPFLDNDGERAVLVLEEGKVVIYNNAKPDLGKSALFVQKPEHAEEFYNFQESLVGWYDQFKIPGSGQKIRPKKLGIEYFTPPPKKEYICENKNFDVELVAEKFFQTYPDLEGVYKLDSGSTRLSAKQGIKTCPCGGVHEGTGGGVFQSRGKKGKPFRYVFWCYQCSAASEPFYHEDGAEEAEEEEWKTEEEIEEERLAKEEAEEEERVRRLEKKEAMEAEKIGRVKAKYIMPDEDEENPKYITRESYTGFRERVDAPNIADHIDESTSHDVIEASSEKKCAKELALWFCKLARDLSPFYKVTQSGVLYHYNEGKWEKFTGPAATAKYTFLYTADGKEGKVMVTATQVLTGSFFRKYPFNKLGSKIKGEAEAEWTRIKTRLPTITCNYNYFKGQPVPLYNSRCVNTAAGYKAIPIFTDDYSEIQPIIDHIKYSHCAGNEEDFDSLMKIITYPMVNTHNPKSQKCPVIMGVGNLLKTQIWGGLMRNVYGRGASASVRVKHVTADKNDILKFKTYLVFDEPDTNKGGAKPTSYNNDLIELFKDIITAFDINIREMYKAGKEYDNVANLIVLSNTWDISFIDREDKRRFWFLKAKLISMLPNGVRVVSSDETYEDVTYLGGGKLSAEDEVLLAKDNVKKNSASVTRYIDWCLESVAGGQGHMSQRCANLFAGWLITNYGDVKFTDLPIQSGEAVARKDALKGLTGQAQKFFDALSTDDYTWVSNSTPLYVKRTKKRPESHYVSDLDLYNEFRAFRRATCNGFSYDMSRFHKEFMSLVAKTDLIVRCARVTVNGKVVDNRAYRSDGSKVKAGFYIVFAEGFTIEPFKNTNASAADYSDPNLTRPEDNNEDEATKIPEPTNTEEDDDPVITLKSSKKKTTITEATKIPTYNIIPADQPDTSELQREIQRMKEKAKKAKEQRRKDKEEMTELRSMMKALLAKK